MRIHLFLILSLFLAAPALAQPDRSIQPADEPADLRKLVIDVLTEVAAGKDDVKNKMTFAAEAHEKYMDEMLGAMRSTEAMWDAVASVKGGEQVRERLTRAKSERLALFKDAEVKITGETAVVTARVPRPAVGIDVAAANIHLVRKDAVWKVDATKTFQMSDEQNVAEQRQQSTALREAQDSVAELYRTGKEVDPNKASSLLRRALVSKSLAKGAKPGEEKERKAPAETPGAARAEDPMAERETKRIITPSPVSALSIADEGRLIVAGLSSGPIPAAVWDLESGALKLNMEADPKIEFHAYAVALSPDARHVFAAGCGYDKAALDERRPRYQDDVYSIVDPSDFRIRVWDVAGGKVVRTLDGHTHQVRCMALSPDGKLLATGAWDSTLRIWDPATGEQKLSIDAARKPLGVGALVFTPDGKNIVTSANDGLIRVWSVADAKELRRMELDRATPAVAIIPGQSRVACGHVVSIKQFDLATGDPAVDLPFPPGEGMMNRVNAIVLAPDAARLAACNGLPTPPSQMRKHNGLADRTQEIRMWNPVSGELILTLKGHANAINALAYTHDGRLVSGSTDCSIRVWDVAVVPPKR